MEFSKDSEIVRKAGTNWFNITSTCGLCNAENVRCIEIDNDASHNICYECTEKVTNVVLVRFRHTEKELARQRALKTEVLQNDTTAKNQSLPVL